MSETTRRTFVKQCLGAALAWQSVHPISRAAGGTGRPFDLNVIGKIRPRRASAITASSLSVGFESLDLEMFDPRPTYRLLADLGVKWARVQTGWARTERAAGRYDFAWLDKVVDSLRAVGIQPWFNVGDGNHLYWPEAPDVSAMGWTPLVTDRARDGWGRYLAAITQHFADRVTCWEIGNEPNGNRFRSPGEADPKDYVRLVGITAPAIRQRIPQAVIVGGALFGMPLEYLERCMDAGLGDLVDKISYHPYDAVPEAGYENRVARFRKALARYKPDLKLWQGECGVPSEPGSSGALDGPHWHESSQARWLLRRVLSDLSLDIELTSYSHIVDLVGGKRGLSPAGRTDFKGLLRGTDYSPKPSYYAYQCLTALFDADTKRIDLATTIEMPPRRNPLLERDIIQAASFVRRGRLMFAYWLPASVLGDVTPQQISLALPAGGEAKLDEPVLINPLTAQVLNVPNADQSGGTWHFGSLPLVEYPLILADRGVTTGVDTSQSVAERMESFAPREARRDGP